jgi:PAS domain S-box-containing protein
MIQAKENLSQPLGETKINDDQFVKMIAEIKDYAVVLLDSNGMIQNWNQGAEKIYGYKESEIIGKSFKNFYPKEDQSQKLPENLLKQATEQCHARGLACRKRWKPILGWCHGHGLAQ